MKKISFKIITQVFLILIISCSENPQKEFSDEEIDFQNRLVEAFIEIEFTRKEFKAHSKEHFIKILEKHEISQEEFEKTLEKFDQDQELFKIFLDSVKTKLEKLSIE